MNISFRTQCIIGVTSLICILVAGTSFALLQEIGPSPAALLPAERTLLLITNLSPDLQRTWQQTLPDLQDAPLTENGPMTAALIQKGQEKEWVLFDVHGMPSTKKPLLMNGEASLSSEDSYRQLRATYTASSPWMFVRFPEVPLAIEGLETPSLPITITIGTGSVSIAWPMRMESALIGLVSEEIPTTIASISAAKLGTLIMNIGALLTDNNTMIATSILQTWIQEIFGSDVSAQYDMLPLLDGVGTINIAQNNSGSLNVAVRVQPEELQEMSIDRLKKGAMNSGKDSKHISNVFDETFTFDTIVKTDDAPYEATKMGIWDVSSTSGTNMLFAETKHAWALGNEQELFHSLLSTMMPVLENAIGMGVLDIQIIDSILQRFGMRIHIPWELLLGVNHTAHWTLKRQGGLAVLHINR